MKDRDFFAKRPGLQLALRELSNLWRTPAFWLGYCCVWIMLIVSAPFDSGEEFTAVQRAVYWAGVSVATFFPGFVIMRWVRHASGARGLGRWPSCLAGAAASALPIGLTVFAINSYIAGNDDGELKDAVRLVFLCAPIALAVAVIAELMLGREEAEPVERPSRLMARLRPKVRGEVQVLHAQGHYVEVTTRRGAELVLIRLADAIDELGAADGVQTHRSWWVARGAVQELARDGHKMSLMLKGGGTVPVGRSRQQEVRAWWAR